MGAFANTIRVMITRPFIVLYFAFFCLLYAIIDSYNFLFTIFTNFNTLGQSSIFEAVVDILQLVLRYLFTPQAMGLLAGFLLGASILFGLVLSGWMNVVNNALDGKPRIRGEFVSGIGRYFFKVSIITFVIILSSVVLVMIILVSVVPALVVTKAAIAGRTEFFLISLAVDSVTGVVLFFGLMFFRVYATFWYPSAINNGRKTFLTGKRAADYKFWRLMARFVVFDIIFIASQIMFFGITNPLVLLICKWLFCTFFFSFLGIYMFALYKSAVKSRSFTKNENAVQDM